MQRRFDLAQLGRQVPMKLFLSGTALFAALAITAPVSAQTPYGSGEAGDIANQLNRQELDRLSGAGAPPPAAYGPQGYPQQGYPPQGYAPEGYPQQGYGTPPPEYGPSYGGYPYGYYGY